MVEFADVAAANKNRRSGELAGAEIRRPSSTVLGFDLGGTKTAVVEGSCRGEILQRIEIPTMAAESFDRTCPLLAERGQRVIEQARAAGRRICAVSVSVGGPLRIGEGYLINPPHLPGWHDLPLKARLEEIFP